MMEQQPIFGMAGVGFFGVLVIGFLAGWIAERAMNRDHGLLTNILIGIAGSFVGGTLAGLLGFQWYGFIGNLVVATGGAIGILWVFGRRETSRRERRPERSPSTAPKRLPERVKDPYAKDEMSGNSPIYHAKSDSEDR